MVMIVGLSMTYFGSIDLMETAGQAPDAPKKRAMAVANGVINFLFIRYDLLCSMEKAVSHTMLY
jgi:uncharacterized membrane protein